MLQTILLVAMILISLSLTAVVLLQRSEGGALGMGGGPSGMMTARGAGNLLTTTTWWLAALGIICAISLTIVGNMSRGSGSIIDADAVGALAAPTTSAAEGEAAPADAATPTAPTAAPSLGDLEADLAAPAPATTPANPAPAN